MTVPALHWARIEDRSGCRILQSFTCAPDRPRTPGGRRLPHPTPWAWEAQRHLRQTSQLLRPGDLVLVGSTDGHEVVAAVHLQFDARPHVLEVFVAALGVAGSVQHQGGVVADAAMAAVSREAVIRAAALGPSVAVITGKIHLANVPSQRLVQRAGFEPQGPPVGPYQPWVLVLRLAA